MDRNRGLLVLVLYGALVAPQVNAIDIRIRNTDTGDWCTLHMGNAEADALQNEAGLTDLMVRGTFDDSDPCHFDTYVPPPPGDAPTGSVTLPSYVEPREGVPFTVEWATQQALQCNYVGTGWSGTACGGDYPPCTSSYKFVTLDQGSYTFGLSCRNATTPWTLVAQPTFVVGPPPPKAVCDQTSGGCLTVY